MVDEDNNMPSEELKTAFQGIRLSVALDNDVQNYADEMFEGNKAMAARTILTSFLNKWKAEQSAQSS